MRVVLNFLEVAKTANALCKPLYGKAFLRGWGLNDSLT